MRRLLFPILFSIIILNGRALAQQESLGEQSSVFTCFYECKPGPTVRGTPTWQEITTLMLVNQAHSDIPPPVPLFVENTRVVRLAILDGNENLLARTQVDLSKGDLDEINICRTLQASNITPPQAGVIFGAVSIGTVAGPDPRGGVSAWVKNLLGKFFVTVDEPFAGRVSGLAKARCERVPPSIANFVDVSIEYSLLGFLFDGIPAILVEGTDDD